ncbi:MAG: hypothetical protein ACK4HB_02690 [Candidatus Bipolaricaulia bacterium]
MTQTKLKRFQEWLRVMGTDFDRAVLDDPDFAASIPLNAYVLFQLKVDGVSDPQLLAEVEEFNDWLRGLAKRQRDPDQPIYRATLVIHYRPPEKIGKHKLIFDRRSLERFPRDFQITPMHS